MKRYILPAIITLCASLTARAAEPLRAYGWYGSPINGVALDAASSSFTVIPSEYPERNGVYGIMVVWVTITDSNDSVTAINMSCTGSHDRGATDYTLQDITVAAGVGTSVNSSWTKDPSGITSPKKWPWRVDIEGMPEVECTFTDTGGNSSDTIGVTVTFATKGG